MSLCFITGGNRGIGKAILMKFAKAGYDIVVSTRKRYPEFENQCREIELENACRIHHIYMDLAVQDSIKQGLAAFSDLKITPDVIINNAGVFSEKSLMMTSMNELQKIFQVNYFAVVQISQYMAKKMLRKGGVIINISSIAAESKQPLGTSYPASKAALNRLTQSMAQELAPFDIRVNAVSIGIAGTEMINELSEQSRQTILNATALKKCAEPQNIADVVYFLADKESNFINGQIIRVDGGLNF